MSCRFSKYFETTISATTILNLPVEVWPSNLYPLEKFPVEVWSSNLYLLENQCVQIGKFNLTSSVLVAFIVVSKYFGNLQDIVKSHFRVFLWTSTKKFVPIEHRDLASRGRHPVRLCPVPRSAPSELQINVTLSGRYALKVRFNLPIWTH